MNLHEVGHRKGCECGFCRNKGSFGKKKAGADDKAEDAKGDKKSKGVTAESIVNQLLR